MTEALLVLIIVLVMPLTFSIAAGIAFGFFAYVGVKTLSGEHKQLPAGVWLISASGLMWLILSTI